MRKILKWVGIVLLSPVLLFVLVALLLYLPPLQDYAVKQVADLVAESTGMRMRMEKVRLAFPLNLVIEGAEVNDDKQDLRMRIGRLRIDVQVLPLLHKEVDIEGIRLQNATFDTGSMIATVRLKGEVGNLYLQSKGVDLNTSTLLINELSLTESGIQILLRDTVTPKDTTTSSTPWNIQWRKIDLQQVDLALQMNDSVSVSTSVGRLGLYDGNANLATSAYRLRQLILDNASLTYDADARSAHKGLDVSHIVLQKIAMQLDSVHYAGKEMSLVISKLEAKERSGLQLLSGKGQLKSDNEALHLTGLCLQTADSQLDGSARVDWTALDTVGDGNLKLRLLAGIGKNDLMACMDSLSQTFAKEYPNKPLNVRMSVDGNLKRLRLTTLQAELDGAFNAALQGEIHEVTDSLHRRGQLSLEAQTGNLSFLTTLVDPLASGTLAIPDSIRLEGNASLQGGLYDAGFVLTTDTGRVSLQASCQEKPMAYKAKLAVDSLQLHEFLPKDSIRYLSLDVDLEGKGTDFYSPRTTVKLAAALDTLQYGHYCLSDIALNGSLEQGKLLVTLDSDNALLKTRTQLDGHLGKEGVDGKLVMDVQSVDWHELRLVENPLKTAFRFSVDARSDRKKLIDVKGALQKLKVTTANQQFVPKELFFDAYTQNDSTNLCVSAGDFEMRLTASNHWEEILSRFTAFSTALMRQTDEKHIDLNELKPHLPELCLKLDSGTDNPINNFLKMKGFAYNHLFIDLDTSPEEGINGDSYLYALQNDSVCVDTLRFEVRQDSAQLKLFSEVRNGPANKRFVFDATLQGVIHDKGARMELNYRDGKQRQGVHLGFGLDMVEEGLRGYFFPEHPIIAYHRFNLNDNNHLLLRNNGRIEGDVELLTDEGMGLRFYSTPNEAVQQDLTLNLYKLDIGELVSVIPYAPRVTGLLNTEVHYMQDGDRPSVLAETSVERLTYERCPIGNLSNSTIYLPKENKTHYVETRLSKDDEEILVLQGDYKEAETGLLDMSLALEHFPLDVANSFIPDKMVALEGDVDGTLTVRGTVDRPIVNGEMMLDSVFLDSDIYGVRFRFDNRPVSITNSSLKFDRFNIYTKSKEPFNIDGTVNFANFEKVKLDLQMRATDYELVNAPRKKNSVVYGKVYVDFFSSLSGTLNQLKMRGYMNVQGKTDVTYVLKDTPLTVEDRLSDLVTFVNFSDTVTLVSAEKKERTLSGMDLLMNVQVDTGAELRVDLSANQESYVELRGGGNLALQYTPQGDLLLSGKYTLTGGEMKYELPIIPLKTFTIKNGSFVEFTGDPMNPNMNISATERVKAQVEQNGVSRSVSFDVGVAITNTLENMGLAFTLEAPEDMTVQNELAAMSLEERGKVAVAMLATGMYIGSNGSTGGFSTGNALNSFLQSEISSIAGSALKTVDISVGLEDETSADGSSRTNYSFRFAKRFWNNRVSVVIGGRISSGNDAENTGRDQSFIDDVSLEYRLDDSGTRYVRLFHNKNYESVLEGEVTKTGVGVVLRKKMTRLGELFVFKKRKGRPLNNKPISNGDGKNEL